ncbi:AtpZ/AtpI family protein [Thermonema rossianum]|uniref:AtpZ/AtpI family protein n=1 Tax=Thermonema rossianum TaxID=55505 RepID=UPI0012F7358F|nr:AtpZ/AtpI family protein [Thermonema rossianum]
MSKNEKKPRSKPLHDYMRYSGLGIQMLATIGIFLWIGMQIDRKLSWEFPVFTIIFVLIGIVGSIISLIKNLSQDS